MRCPPAGQGRRRVPSRPDRAAGAGAGGDPQQQLRARTRERAGPGSPARGGRPRGLPRAPLRIAVPALVPRAACATRSIPGPAHGARLARPGAGGQRLRAARAVASPLRRTGCDPPRPARSWAELRPVWQAAGNAPPARRSCRAHPRLGARRMRLRRARRSPPRSSARRRRSTSCRSCRAGSSSTSAASTASRSAGRRAGRRPSEGSRRSCIAPDKLVVMSLSADRTDEALAGDPRDARDAHLPGARGLRGRARPVRADAVQAPLRRVTRSRAGASRRRPGSGRTCG